MPIFCLPVRRATPVLSALCLACFASGAHAGDDAIASGRPDAVESSNVIGRGVVQLETGIDAEGRVRTSGQTRALTTPVLLRMGLGHGLELQVSGDGRSVQRDAGGTTAGWADGALGLKWHVRDAGDALPSVGVLVQADLPTGSRAVRGDGVRPSLRASAEWEWEDGLSLGVMPGIGFERDGPGGRHAVGGFAIALGKAFSERLRGLVEWSAPQIARARDGGVMSSVDVGAAYLLTPDCQLDVLVARGVNRNTADWRGTVGVSWRL